MQVCPNCSHRNRPGVVFCENCGASMIGDSPLSTKTIASGKDAASMPAGAIRNALEAAGSDLFEQGAVLRIEIEGAEPILLKPKQETIFGRRDPATGLMPDVDLTPFAGYRMGVSRRHAAIRQNQDNRLDLWDLGSSNGTFLNGKRLDANTPNGVHDGDEIRLGQMLMHIYYQHKISDGSENKTSAESLGINPNASIHTTINVTGNPGIPIPKPPAQDADNKAVPGTSILNNDDLANIDPKKTSFL